MNVKLSCKQVSRLFSEGADRELPRGDRARLRLHLVICDACRNVEEQMVFLRQAMRTLGRDDEPPARS
jgi:hypothetical protein